MHNTLFIALLGGAGGMIGWGAADFFAKKTIDRIDAIKSLVWAHAFGASFFILAALLQVARGGHITVPHSGTIWLGLAFFGVLQMIVYWLVYEGFNKGQLAVLNPVFASFSGLVALGSIIFFGEKLSVGIVLGLVALFIGILAMNLDPQSLRSKKLNIVPGLKEVGIATILATVWTLGWDKFVHGHDALSYATYMYIFMSLGAFGLARIMRVKLAGVSKDLWKFLALIGLGETLAYLAISYGYSNSPRTSVVALVSGCFSVPTVILAYIFLKERITRLQTVSVLVIVVGIVLISIA